MKRHAIFYAVACIPTRTVRIAGQPRRRGEVPCRSRPARSCSPDSQILGAVWHHRTSKGPFKPKSVPLYAPCSLHGVKNETTILVHFWRGATMTAHAQLCTDPKYAFRFLAMVPFNYPSHWFAIRMLPRLTLTEQRRSLRQKAHG